MPTVRLTKRAMDVIPPAKAGQVRCRDADLPSSGLRVGARSKVYFAEARVRRRTIRVTMDRYGPVTPHREGWPWRRVS